MTKVTQLNHTDARAFFLKEESYSSIELPEYFTFQNLLDKVSDALANKPVCDFYDGDRPYKISNVNYRFLMSKDGEYAWRPISLIHPVLYVALVNKITEEANWNEIVGKFNEFEIFTDVTCQSIPLKSEEVNQSDRATVVANWIKNVEQKSIELALEYKYMLQTDIQNCYGSIYTHSIAWALHGREYSKENKREKNLGNAIDGFTCDMSYGQTNGIPQGSVLMDLIAELVLGYVDTVLSDKIRETSIDDFEIIRYRDDYRIFTNNPENASVIAKLLSESLSEIGLQLNEHKTSSSNDVIKSSIKADKLGWIKYGKEMGNLKDYFLFIHSFAAKHPNSGALVVVLKNLYSEIENAEIDADIIKVLISIMTDIAYKNPRTYPFASAILSKLINEIEQNEEREKIIDLIVKKFEDLPNTGLMEIWLQRITLPTIRDKEYSETLCKKINNSDTELWNSEWLNENIKNIIKTTSIIDEEVIEGLNLVIGMEEVDLFGSIFS